MIEPCGPAIDSLLTGLDPFWPELAEPALRSRIRERLTALLLIREESPLSLITRLIGLGRRLSLPVDAAHDRVDTSGTFASCHQARADYGFPHAAAGWPDRLCTSCYAKSPLGDVLAAVHKTRSPRRPVRVEPLPIDRAARVETAASARRSH